MKHKVYEDKELIIYSKVGEGYTGEEADFADSLMEVALIGYIKFAEHLKEPKKFWENAKFAILQRVADTEEEIKKL